MSTGKLTTLGLGREATWGTGVAPTLFIDASQNLDPNIGRIYDANTFGHKGQLPPDAGRIRLNGKTLNAIDARPEILGELLRAALGPAVSSGAAAPYSHVFKFGNLNSFSLTAANPPYSVQAKASASHIIRYYGGQLSSLSLKQGSDNRLTLDSNWIFKGSSAEADVVPVKENAKAYNYRNLTIKRAGTGTCEVRDLNITFDNALEADETLCGTDEISAVVEGANSNVKIDMTLNFSSENTYQDFKNNTNNAWEYKWLRDASNELLVEIPSFNIDAWGMPVSNAGKLSVRVSGQANYDAALGYAAQVTLKNAVASYT